MKLAAKLLAVALVAATTAQVATPAPAGTLSVAKRYIGLQEHKNRRTINSLIGVNPSRTPWCGFFMSAVVRKSGKRPPAAPGFARSWSRYGKKVARNGAKAGDVVVIRTRYGYHVGVLVALNRGSVQLLGGNQSNRVQVSRYSSRAIVSIRR